MAEYRPRRESGAILDAAWRHVGSVPYRVSVRWLFYRLLQDGHFSDKEDYGRLLTLLSAARKRFYKEWRPDTLADDTRHVSDFGRGYMTHEEWLRRIPKMIGGYPDYWKRQPNYVLVCFEAAAMSGQFDHYLPSFISRCAFKGDVSIPTKWEIAELLGYCARKYQKPVKVVYFGDLDPKGLIIPESAMADIEAWATCDFEYTRAGLNPGDENTYEISENPDRPGTYQWEGLDDEEAGRLITSAVAEYIDAEAAEESEAEGERRTEAFGDWWQASGPDVADLGL